jgi:Mg-chelatase subunit ChlD
VSVASNQFPRGPSLAPVLSTPPRILSKTELDEAREIADALSGLRTRTTPLVDRRQRSGRFDPRSAMRAERDPDDDRLFRRTSAESRDPESLAVILVLDLSFSMTIRDADRKATSAVAVLVEALSRTGSRSAIVAFTERAWVAKEWNEPGTLSIRPLGFRSSDGLEPALSLAEGLFEASERGLPVLVLLSDGFGEVPRSVEGILDRLRDDGVRSLGLRLHPKSRPLGEDVVLPVGRSESFVPAFVSFLSTLESEVGK